jgi:hypothetical protein
MSQNFQKETGLKARQLGLRLGVPRTTWQRWHRRGKREEPLLQKSGPKKLGPLPMAQVALEIQVLRHGLKRSRGTGKLYERHKESLSRRELAKQVKEERQKQNKQKRRNKCRVEWKLPNLVWAIDATEHERDGQGRRLWTNVIKDLATRYKLEPLTVLECKGSEVAAHLEMLFRKHGAPLFLKRDNASVFNCQPVNDAMARWGVIPLNSPPYYPSYNGGVEKGIRELKERLKRELPVPESWDVTQVGAFVAVAAAEENHKPRRCLGGATAREVYGKKQERHRWSQRERHEAFVSTTARAKAILETTMKTDQRSVDTAWRLAVEAWLCDQALIEVHINR